MTAQPTERDREMALRVISRMRGKRSTEWPAIIAAALARARAEERERCARIADSNRLTKASFIYGTNLAAVHDGACNEIAGSIRSLSEDPANG